MEGATPRRRRIHGPFHLLLRRNCYGVVVVGRFSPDLVDERPPVDPRAGTNATTRTLGGAVGQVKPLGITWQPRSGTNCIHLARRFAPTWHPELRRSMRGGGRSKMTWSPRSPYEGNLTVAAHGSEPLTPTAGVKNRYSVLARRRFSPARLAKTPTLGNCACVDSQWVGTFPFCRRASAPRRTSAVVARARSAWASDRNQARSTPAR